MRKPEVRWAQHEYASRVGGSSLAIHKALRIDGLVNFSFEVLWEGPLTQLRQQEAKFIKERKSEMPFGYNMCPGGRGAPLRTLQTKAMLRFDIKDLTQDVLVVPNGLKFRPTTSNRECCMLSLQEATQLIDWGVQPTCKAHHHIRHSKVTPDKYKFLETVNGDRTRFVIALTEFYKTIEWGWGIQTRSVALG